MNTMQSPTEELVPEPQRESNAADYWEALSRATNAEQLCAAWLPILCTMSPTAHHGLLLLEDDRGSYVPAALWPAGADLGHLRDIAEEALNTRRGAVNRDHPERTQVAYPLLVGETLFGVVILDLMTRDAAAVTEAMRLLHWGAGWLMDLHHRRTVHQQGARLDRSAYLFDLVLAALAETDVRKAALAVVNRLAQRFACHQVQFGVEKGKTVRVEAVSHTAWFDDKANLVNLAALAMNEAFDQRAQIVLPEPSAGVALITAAHRRYGEECGSAALASIPLQAGARVVGVWLLERDTPFSGEELEILEALALTLGPILELKQAGDESLVSHGRRALQHTLRHVTDTSLPGIKLIAVATGIVVLLLAVVQVDYRVGAPAVIEGSTQRAAVAPFQGYIQTAPGRAGDLVRAGQVLATLEDKDLLLERARWQAEHEVAQRKAQEAMAKGDRVELRLASAQADQAGAQLDLVLEKLTRVQITAPFDGIVVRGDLSQQIGSPVEQGKLLFEISPLETWRVILKVDERDIGYLAEGMAGELMLTSLPSQSYPLTVKKVTPVATAEDGRNYFRVEAGLGGAVPALRPNMEGVGKVVAGQRSLLWIWTHRLADWLRLTYWKVMP